MSWSDERKPSPGDAVRREDGRVCRVKGYEVLQVANPSQRGNTPRMGELGTSDMPPTPAGFLHDYPAVEMACSELVPPRILTMCVFWPAVANEAVTCPGCIEAEQQ